MCISCRWHMEVVTGQNGSGQNGTDKMVWTKWYTAKIVLDKMVAVKMVGTKWYGWNITNKVNNQSHSHWQYDFFINPASTLTPLAFCYVLIIFSDFWLLNIYCTILSNTILSVYHFVHTILSVLFCPLPFCPVTLRGALSPVTDKEDHQRYKIWKVR